MTASFFIDTHCHLDSPKFSASKAQIVDAAWKVGVRVILIPAIEQSNFSSVIETARKISGGTYALGIHPSYVEFSTPNDLVLLHKEVERAINDPRFIAIGEIGLDFFKCNGSLQEEIRKKQELFYFEQLKLAEKFKLPILLHARKSQDKVLKYIHRVQNLVGGIVHAFNGSHQQARDFVNHGFALGFGKMITNEKAVRIRNHVNTANLQDIVLETDSPDGFTSPIKQRIDKKLEYNTPKDLIQVATTIAKLRKCSLKEVAIKTTSNAKQVLPRLKKIIDAGFPKNSL